MTPKGDDVAFGFLFLPHFIELIKQFGKEREGRNFEGYPTSSGGRGDIVQKPGEGRCWRGESDDSED